MAELASPAHWSYKEGSRGKRRRRREKLKCGLAPRCSDWQQEIQDPKESWRMKVNLSDEEVFVFTPRARSSAGSRRTAAGLRYEIHKELGHR